MKTYYATVDGHINGAYRLKGDTCGAMTERQAKYGLMSGIISETAVQGAPAPDDDSGSATAPVEEQKRAEPDPATLDRKTR